MKKKLSAVVLNSLRGARTPYYVSDEQNVGLRVRVAPNGVLTWGLSYRIKGAPKTKSVSLGPCDPNGRNGLGLAEARARASDVIKAARLGRDLLEEERNSIAMRKSRITVGQLVDQYAANIKSPNRKGGALSTSSEIEKRLRRALHPKIDVAADDISRGHISGLLDPLSDEIPREAEKRRQVIGAMFRWGVAKGYVAGDPTFGTEGYGRGNPRERVLSPDDIKAVWKWFDDGAEDMPPDCISALRLQFFLGARIGEIAGMSCSEFSQDGEKLLWTLPASRSKNKQDRVTPLIGTAKTMVEDALTRRKRGALFRAAISDRALTASDIGHALKRRKLPCEKFMTHDIRRTVVTNMDEIGIPLDTIAAAIGHQRGTRNTRTLIRHYSRPRLDSHVEAALNLWDGRLNGLLTDRAPSADNVTPIRVNVRMSSA